MTTPANTPPSGKRSVPGIPSKQVWDANSFRTPDFTSSPLHWLGRLPKLFTIVIYAGAILLLLKFLNLW